MPPARLLIGARTPNAALSPATRPRLSGTSAASSTSSVRWGCLPQASASAGRRNRSAEPSAGRQLATQRPFSLARDIAGLLHQLSSRRGGTGFGRSTISPASSFSRENRNVRAESS